MGNLPFFALNPLSLFPQGRNHTEKYSRYETINTKNTSHIERNGTPDHFDKDQFEQLKRQGTAVKLFSEIQKFDKLHTTQ